jgi:hypothetical protein
MVTVQHYSSIRSQVKLMNEVKLMDISLSKHAGDRCRQRGLTNSALQLVVEFGEGVDDGYVMTKKAIAKARKALKAEFRSGDIQKLDHLRNVAVIDLEATVLTVYRADRKRIGRLRKGPLKAEQTSSKYLNQGEHCGESRS